jgi:hypothetical protein
LPAVEKELSAELSAPPGAGGGQKTGPAAGPPRSPGETLSRSCVDVDIAADGAAVANGVELAADL